MTLREMINADPRGYNVHCKCGECIAVQASAINEPVKCPKCGAMIEIVPEAKEAAERVNAEMAEAAKRLGFKI